MSDTDKPVIKRPRMGSDTDASSSAASSSSASGYQQGAINQQQPDNSHENETSNSLMRLNDDCLWDILNYSNDEDLSQLADVCTRLRPIVEKTFRKRYKEKYCVYGDSLIDRVLCKFGHLITSCWIDLNSKHNYALAEYCTSLTFLRLYESTIDGALKILFERLKKLYLMSCYFKGNTRTLFANCSKLECLCIHYPEDCNINFIANKYPNLVQLNFRTLHYEGYTFRKLLNLNPQLQKLETMVEDARSYSDIARFAKNLEHLIICCTLTRTRNLCRLSELTNLRRFEFTAPYMKANLIAPLMKAFLMENVTLEYLYLDIKPLKFNDIESILQLKTLKILKLFRVNFDSDDDLVSLATELPLLTELQLHFEIGFRPISLHMLKNIVKAGKNLDTIRLDNNNIHRLMIDLTDYKTLLDAASKRLNQNKLSIEIWGFDNNVMYMVDIPRNVQRQNHHKLEIISKNHNSERMIYSDRPL